MNNGSNKRLQKKLSVSKKPDVKVDSPLAKYDSSGTLTCIICRIPIKPSVWKVHINSKQHKQNVDQAKQNKIEKPVTTRVFKEPSVPSSVSVPTIPTSTSHPDKTPQTSSQEKNPAIIPEKTPQPNASNKTATESASEKLPEKFFDEDKTSKTEAARLQDEEWQRFQQEIKRAETVSSVIVADEQEDINLKRHIKEIDEQIDNWKRFIKINDQKTLLLNKKRRVNPKVEVDPELSSGSEEDESIDDLFDWRTKNLHR
ncbi:zinc finger protein 830 [Drosophila takahashii]|uniref:zinc finger protein 830 n=1 Tax=Drosophila takahashii TaxID=29030 RepID=UPI001CF83012|nr:zinc finger protein 830 [Drosophila takahashii]